MGTSRNCGSPHNLIGGLFSSRMRSFPGRSQPGYHLIRGLERFSRRKSAIPRNRVPPLIWSKSLSRVRPSRQPSVPIRRGNRRTIASQGTIVAVTVGDVDVAFPLSVLEEDGVINYAVNGQDLQGTASALTAPSPVDRRNVRPKCGAADGTVVKSQELEYPGAGSKAL